MGTKHWLGKVLLLELSSSADTGKFMPALRTVDTIEKFLHITGTNLRTGELQKVIGLVTQHILWFPTSETCAGFLLSFGKCEDRTLSPLTPFTAFLC